jgi:hypothetical protein
MPAPAASTNPRPQPPRTHILRGLGFLAAAILSLGVEAVARESFSRHEQFVVRVPYWLLLTAQTLSGAAMVLIIPPYVLLSEGLPWWLRRYSPEQWKVWQRAMAARGGPPSRWHLFTFGCFFIGGLAMLLPVATMLFGGR